MTVQFDILGAEWPTDCHGFALPPAPMFLSISNANAKDFFAWIGLDNTELIGEMPARELAAILRRRLWPERNGSGDAGVPTTVHRDFTHATVIAPGRPAGRLAEYAQRLLRLAEFAGDGVIVWD